MRKPFICANWKMNNTVPEALKFVAVFTAELKATGSVDVVIAPSFTALYSTNVALADTGTGIKLAAQNLFWEESGAFTGEVAGSFLKDVGCDYAIVGHSERRQFFGETNETVNLRIKASIRSDLVPIFCVGETLAERAASKTWSVVETQLLGGLKGIELGDLRDFVIAYEPVWAIGTGKTATPAEAEDVHKMIRQYLTDRFSHTVADKIRIIYGGSVKPSNSREILAEANIDGALVGGTSLNAKHFADIVRSAH